MVRVQEQSEPKPWTEMRSIVRRVLLCFAPGALVHLVLIAGPLGPPQLVHLFIDLSVPSSPVLHLHTHTFLLLIHVAHIILLFLLINLLLLFLLLLSLHLHADLALQVQGQRGAQARGPGVSVDAEGSVGAPQHILGAVAAILDGGGAGRLVADGGDVAAAVGVVDRW